jgi:hypothetical protein
MKCENPLAAVVRNEPMLCTRCAALSGCWMIHQRTNATAAQVRTVFRFTAASWKRRRLHFPPVHFYPSFNLARMRSRPRVALPWSTSAAVCPEHRGATHAPSREYAGPAREVCSRGRRAGSSHAGAMPENALLVLIVADFSPDRSRICAFRLLEVRRSDNIHPCKACLGHGDA